MAIALLITGIDSSGRPVGRLITNDDGIYVLSDSSVPLVPEVANFAPDDRHSVRIPVRDGSLLPDVAPRDVILTDGVGWPDGKDGLSFLPARPFTVLANDTDDVSAPDTVRQAVDSMEPGDASRRWLAGHDELTFEADARRAAEEPNDILTLAFLDDEGKMETQCLAHRGSYMFWEAQAGESDMAAPTPASPGLWLLRNGDVWISTDWETGIADAAGIEGVMDIVTVQDAAAHFGLTAEALMKKIEEAYPYFHDVDVLDALHLPAGALPKRLL